MSKLKYKDSDGTYKSLAPSQKEFDDFNVSVTSALAEKVNKKDIDVSLPSSYIGQDIASALQALLDDPNIFRVRVLAGDYYLSQKVVIPDNKELLLTGNNGAKNINEPQANPNFWTKIHPTFNNDYCFELKNKSVLRNGFINCRTMTASTTGGAVLVDFGRQERTNVLIDGVVVDGGRNFNLTAVMFNGDRPSGTTAGYAYFNNINVGAIDIGTVVQFKRLDTYTTIDYTGTTGIAWFNSMRISGLWRACQRYVWVNTYSSFHSMATSIIEARMQAGPVPDPMIPAIEINGEGAYLNCQFHDFKNQNGMYQKIKYKISQNSTLCTLASVDREDSAVIDLGLNTNYLNEASENEVAMKLKVLNGVAYSFYIKNSRAVWTDFTGVDLITDGSATSNALSGTPTRDGQIGLIIKNPKKATFYSGSFAFNVKCIDFPKQLYRLEMVNPSRLSGDIAELPLLKELSLNGLNRDQSNFTGDIANLPQTLTNLTLLEDVGAYSVITGKIADLPKKLTYLSLRVKNLTGDLANLPTTITGKLSITNSSSVTGALSNTTQSTDINLTGLGLGTANVDTTVRNIDAAGKTNGTLTLPSAPTTAGSGTAYNSLISKGWTITPTLV